MDDKCFALRECHDGSTVCICLENPNCPGYATCAFYKPGWKYKRERDRANMRLRSLPLKQQIHIAVTYYEGRTPWLEEFSGDENSWEEGLK